MNNTMTPREKRRFKTRVKILATFNSLQRPSGALLIKILNFFEFSCYRVIHGPSNFDFQISTFYGSAYKFHLVRQPVSNIRAYYLMMYLPSKIYLPT